ncbi:hypothetical protein [[Eubacterium] cellulosolvens]
MEDTEELIAKIQLEYTTGTSIDIAKGITDWDIGLLYFTNKNLWFINSQKERTQVPFVDIIDIDSVKLRTSEKETKFTKVLEADHVVNIDFKTTIDDNSVIRTIQLSAAREVLKAFCTQMDIRLERKTKMKKGTHKLDKSELHRRLTVLLDLEIVDDDKLEYFLGIPESELVNLMIERSRYIQPAT